jgi:hypothetical protein
MICIINDSMFRLSLFARQGLTVTGTVSDANGVEIHGVRIVVKGSSTGITSNVYVKSMAFGRMP